MLPIILDSSQTPIALVGSGVLLERRYRLLKAADIQDLKVFAGDTDCQIAEATSGFPSHKDLDGIAVLFIAGLEREVAVTLVAEARARGVLSTQRMIANFATFMFLRASGAESSFSPFPQAADHQDWPDDCANISKRIRRGMGGARQRAFRRKKKMARRRPRLQRGCRKER